MAPTVVGRMYRDSRLYRLYEGTSEIQKLIIARELSAARAGGAEHFPRPG
jgi:acyl-CoA dehydrogenase